MFMSIRFGVLAVVASLVGVVGLSYMLAEAAAGQGASSNPKRAGRKREAIRVEHLPLYLDKFKAPTTTVIRSGEMLFVSGIPPFDPGTGEMHRVPIEHQTVIVLDQISLCLEAAGSSMTHVVKLTVDCTSPEKLADVNTVYTRYFPKDPPARRFCVVPTWPAPFDIEMDCIAIRGDH